MMQGGLSAVGCALGLAAAWQLHDVHTAIGAVLLVRGDDPVAVCRAVTQRFRLTAVVG